MATLKTNKKNDALRLIVNSHVAFLKNLLQSLNFSTTLSLVVKARYTLRVFLNGFWGFHVWGHFCIAYLGSNKK